MSNSKDEKYDKKGEGLCRMIVLWVKLINNQTKQIVAKYLSSIYLVKPKQAVCYQHSTKFHLFYFPNSTQNKKQKIPLINAMYLLLPNQKSSLIINFKKANSLTIQFVYIIKITLEIPTQEPMQNKQKKEKQKSFTLSKVSKKIDLLCIGQFNCHFTDFLMEYTQQARDENQIQNVYVKKIHDQVIFFHEWKEKDDLELMQQFEGLLFFVDLVHHLNSTLDTILKYLETLSSMSGVNVFRIPMALIALNGSTLKPKQFDNQKRRLQKKVECILPPSQILYYSGGYKDNFSMIDQKISLFISQIFQNDPQSIRSTWTAYWKMYGTLEMFTPYWTELQTIWLSMIERVFHQQTDSLPDPLTKETKRTSFFGKIKR